ncbi:MAG: nucleoside kinase, partial [Hungatella sp.]
MPQVTIGQEQKEYAVGTSFQTIAKEYQPQYKDDILLVFVNGKLGELHKKLTSDCRLDFVTTKDKPGWQTYQRSATLIMLKAFYEVVGAENIEKVSVDFSLGKGFFIEPKGNFTLTQALLDQIKQKMQEYVAQKIPIMKRNVNTDEAVELFERHRMDDKARLFRYRRVSRVNIYSLGNFEDYYYGYMAQNTEYIRYFDLLLYEDGFVLMTPTTSNTREIPAFIPQEKLYRVLKESSDWGEKLGVPNVGALNEMIAQGKANSLILIQEALQEKRIGQIAEMIA